MLPSILLRSAFARPVLSTPITASLFPSIRFSSTATAPASVATTPTTTTVPLKRREYSIGLTTSNQYPVYLRYKGGRQHQNTIIRKIEGDRRALRNDLSRELSLPLEDIKINPRSQAILVKGKHSNEVKAWLVSIFGDKSLAAKKATVVV
ncbi:54S ribosomal protein IMG2 [Colletotrichum sidae]|uniref:Large ribosomal subunit protein mL49 n=2 Tax=Colletotrichum orbiculare species complex TaxID=2707354 RepID=A0A4R8PZS9_9PEZI|nr:54S ribosomal protein IMG2 [Colletotrichum spinosum]TEA14494.1 54S ribosomal protein IMG2 [Colletotrichum sidae]